MRLPRTHGWLLWCFGLDRYGRSCRLSSTAVPPISELLALQELRTRMRLIPMVETYIESRHKDIKMEGRAKHRVSAPRASLRLRGSEIERLLHSGGSAAAEFMSFLSARCSEMRCMSGLLHSLHLAAHPAIQACIKEQGGQDFSTIFAGHTQQKLVQQVVYRLDGASQYRDLSEFKDCVKADDEQRGKGTDWHRTFLKA